MLNLEEHTAAITNRSLRTIRTELEFLTDSSVITPQQLANFLSQLPNQTVLHAPLSSPAPTPAQPTPALKQTSPVPSPAPNQITTQLNNTSLNEKQGNFYAPNPSPGPPPPAYASSAPVATASALYEYHPSDAGDLALLPNDRIFITEFMNADWAKGRNERTGLEGIFPRSYVAIVDEKNAMAPHQLPPPPIQSSYGNMPLDVSQSGSTSAPQKQSKLNENGKKFGKKMGNAGMFLYLGISTMLECSLCLAIFGAGATIGSNIVNGIF
ncbi:MAG: hypothetical protein Q9217_002474 [Psora testacea]